MTLDGCLRSIEICRRFETSPCCPQEVRNAFGNAGIVVQDNQWPIRQSRISCYSIRQFLIFGEATTFEHQTTSTENGGARNTLWQRSFEFSRQPSDGFAQTQHDGFATLIN